MIIRFIYYQTSFIDERYLKKNTCSNIFFLLVVKLELIKGPFHQITE